MNKPLQFCALSLWSISLALPTLPIKTGGALLGYEVLEKGLIGALMMPFSLFFPAHLLSLASNLVMLNEFYLLLVPAVRKINMPPLVAVALLLNIWMGLATLRATGGPKPFLDGVLQLPGYYVWVSSFLLLFIASLKDKETETPI